MFAARSAGAHEGWFRAVFVNGNGVQRTREGVGGSYCERKRCPVHPEGIRRREMGAEAALSAHERWLMEGVVCGGGRWCTRGGLRSECGRVKVVELWITFAIFVSYNSSYGV